MSNTSQFPCGQTRRQFVWQMGHGVAGLAMTDLLTRDGFFGAPVRAAERDAPLNPLAPKPPQIKPRAKACIFLTMNGAPSQVDTFDYKPELARRAGQPPGRGLRVSSSRFRRCRCSRKPWKQKDP